MRQIRPPAIIDRSRDRDFMREALALAAQGAALGEVPVGAVLVQDGEIIGRGFNCPISGNDPSAHAEMVAIRAAALAASNYRLPGSTLYVTLEPCSMCAGLIVHSRIARVVYGALEPKAGIVQSQGQFFTQGFLNHRVLFEGGVLAEECGAVLSEFFKARRAKPQTKHQTHVGASLLAIAVQSTSLLNVIRYREQARSHRIFWCLGDRVYLRATMTARIGAGSPSIVLL